MTEKERPRTINVVEFRMIIATYGSTITQIASDPSRSIRTVAESAKRILELLEIGKDFAVRTEVPVSTEKS